MPWTNLYLENGNPSTQVFLGEGTPHLRLYRKVEEEGFRSNGPSSTCLRYWRFWKSSWGFEKIDKHRQPGAWCNAIAVCTCNMFILEILKTIPQLARSCSKSPSLLYRIELSLLVGHLDEPAVPVHPGVRWINESISRSYGSFIDFSAHAVPLFHKGHGSVAVVD